MSKGWCIVQMKFPLKKTCFLPFGMIFILIIVAALVSGCAVQNENQSETSAPPGAVSSPPVSATPPATPGESSSESTGESRRFTYQGLEIEVAGLKSYRNETYKDDGGSEVELIVINYLPGAKLTIIKPDMSDASLSADGKPHSKWGIDYQSKQATGDKYRITDETGVLDITPDMLAIYNLEASLYAIKFEAYTP